jgi:hypothetical protein|tara:strand:+ start:77 stop:550 length:474 start_codon:yes stop_codon:yes gene_type:complete
MIRDQLLLWEDPKQIILEKEKVDLSTLKTLKTRRTPMSLLPKGKYFIYKTGGMNPFMIELGPVFPFIKNDQGKIMSQCPLNTGKDAPYPHLNIGTSTGGKKSTMKCFMHKLVGLAFLKNDDFEKKYIIDHLNGNIFDYRPENLEWVTPSENSYRRKK